MDIKNTDFYADFKIIAIWLTKKRLISFLKTFNENARKSNILLNKKIVFCLISINLRYESYQVFEHWSPVLYEYGKLLEYVSYRELFISIIKNIRACFVTKFKFPVCGFIPNKIFVLP